jgi:hypothetical protein
MLRWVLAALAATGLITDVGAQAVTPVDRSASNLMVVLRESQGQNKQDESLVPIGTARATVEGREVSFEPAWYSYLGDMHVRFVFDGPDTMAGAGVDDLKRLQLTPESALELAVANIRRVYGAPVSRPWEVGMQVQGRSPDLDSSYFLDRSFWRLLAKQHPEGLVALVGKRGGLVYTPLSDTQGVETMRRSVAYLHSSSGRLRISSALYLFKDDRWTVFQAPVKP